MLSGCLIFSQNLIIFKDFKVQSVNQSEFYKYCFENSYLLSKNMVFKAYIGWNQLIKITQKVHIYFKCSNIHLSMEELTICFTDIICIIDLELFHHKNENARFLVNGESRWTWMDFGIKVKVRAPIQVTDYRSTFAEYWVTIGFFCCCWMFWPIWICRSSISWYSSSWVAWNSRPRYTSKMVIDSPDHRIWAFFLKLFLSFFNKE